MTNYSPETVQELTAEWLETAVVLRTRALTRQVLLIFCHMTLVGKETVVDLRQLLDQLVSEPQKGVNFILRFDDLLHPYLDSHRVEILETFLKEINDFIDLLSPEKTDPPEKYTEILNDYSRLYGKDSAWN